MWDRIVVLRACTVVPDEIVNYPGMQRGAKENDKSDGGGGGEKKTVIFLFCPTPLPSLPTRRSWKLTGDRNAHSQYSQHALSWASPPAAAWPHATAVLRAPRWLQCGFSLPYRTSILPSSRPLRRLHHLPTVLPHLALAPPLSHRPVPCAQTYSTLSAFLWDTLACISLGRSLSNNFSY